MTTLFETDPDAKAYAFSYRIQVGHALRATTTSELRIEREDPFDEVRLFLDPGELVEGLEHASEALDTNVGFSAQDLVSGEVRALPLVEWRSSPAPAVSARALCGVTITIPAGTELGIATGGTTDAMTLRFPRETAIEIGGAREPLRDHALREMRAVRLHGIPLLEVMGGRTSSVLLRTKAPKPTIVNLLGVVSPYRHRGVTTLVHVMEAIGDRVVGGSSIRIPV